MIAFHNGDCQRKTNGSYGKFRLLLHFLMTAVAVAVALVSYFDLASNDLEDQCLCLQMMMRRDHAAVRRGTGCIRLYPDGLEMEIEIDYDKFGVDIGGIHYPAFGVHGPYC